MGQVFEEPVYCSYAGELRRWGSIKNWRLKQWRARGAPPPRNTTFTTGEGSDSLRFRMEWKRGWFERALGVVLVCICF